MSSQFLYARKTNAWQLARFDIIPAANVLEYVENPAQGQLYAGAAATDAWSVSFRTNLDSLPSEEYAFDSDNGRFLVGRSAGGDNGIYIAGWTNLDLFATGDHSYMFISDGSNIQAYRDNAAVGSAIASGVNIGGVTRWRAVFVDAAYWTAAIRAAHVANVALDATQRAALHTAMMALA